MSDKPVTVTVQAILRTLDRIYPWRFGAPHPAGLLLGLRDAPVTKLLLVSDVTEGALEEARLRKCEAVLSWRPPFDPADSATLELTDRTYEGRIALTAAQRGVALIAGHTSWEAAPGGVLEPLLDALRGTKRRPLVPSDAPSRVLLRARIEPGGLGPIRDALARAGLLGAVVDATPVGLLADRSGITETTRTAPEDKPPVRRGVGRRGATGFPDELAEARPPVERPRAPAPAYALELVVPIDEAKTAATTLRSILADSLPPAAPEPIVDQLTLDTAERGAGLGRVCELPRRVPLKRMASEVRKLLRAGPIRTAGAKPSSVKRLAIALACTPALVMRAANFGAQVLVAPDVTYATARLAMAHDLALFDPGLPAMAQFVIDDVATRLAATPTPDLTIERLSAHNPFG